MSFGSNKFEEYKKKAVELEISNQQLLNECADYKRTIENFPNLKSEYEAKMLTVKYDYENKIQDLMAKHAAEKKQIQSQIEFEKKSVNRKVNLALQSIGVNMFAPEQITDVRTNDSDIIKTWQSMPNGPEKHEFFKSHEKIISAHAGMKKTGNV